MVLERRKGKLAQRPTPKSAVPVPEGVDYLEFWFGKNDFMPTYLTNEKIEELVTILRTHPHTADFDRLLIGMDTNSAKHCWPLLQPALDAQKIEYVTCTIAPGENNKSFASLGHIYDTFFQKAHGTRKTIVLALGGGIVSNIFGLAASTFYRGIRLVQMPTTFLNAHDAGGSSQKQAINCAGRKNVVGTFHLPSLVLDASVFYRTLPPKEIRSGFGELTKNGIAFGGEHTELIKDTTMQYSAEELQSNEILMKRATTLGIQAKATLLYDDPLEKYGALPFEFGHTIGHGYELVMDNTSHGECVAIGCELAAYISWKMDLLSFEAYQQVQAMVGALRPEMDRPCRTVEALVKEVMELIKHDNKRGYLPEKSGFTPMILIRKVGVLHKPNERFLEYVPDALVADAVLHGIERFTCA
eukprot:CAMPEP_0175146628 /NCGR_PEP_ID=MMETSP0087-20121206/15485_1 /TAXON_ID=136419 /ORGANISM="Unknown Unknown, Strain D1" /LENGTH=413 /DNA_ID=CAMNT_0016431613 /DNA_START=149 /DNA_END=1390 /DNA_ORIENTATION=+